MGKLLSGLRDKLFWRPGAHSWHVYKRGADRPVVYVTLCGRGRELRRIGGQGAHRPPVYMRCGMCDGIEMARRDWDESGPESDNWREAGGRGNAS